jgi:hypothetical protein
MPGSNLGGAETGCSSTVVSTAVHALSRTETMSTYLRIDMVTAGGKTIVLVLTHSSNTREIEMYGITGTALAGLEILQNCGVR